MRSMIPNPTGQWSRPQSLGIDRAVVAYESLMGHAVGRRLDRCAIFGQLYAWARRDDPDARRTST